MKHMDIPTVEDIKKDYRNTSNVNSQHKENLGLTEKIGLWITEKVGTMGFFLIILGWTVSWLSWNTLGPPALRFDPFPSFVLWLFISNMIQIFLMPLIMIGQNLQSKHSELKVDEDFLIDQRSEKQIDIILKHLENQEENIDKIMMDIEEMKKNNK